MAKRPSDLGPGISADGNWVIEVDASNGATGTVETKQISITQAVTLGTTATPSFTALSLLNGWTGEVSARSVDDGYLEIFMSVSPYVATADTIAVLPSGLIPDWEVRKYYAYISPNNSTLTIDTSGNISVNDVLTLPITINFSFKVKRLKP